MADFKILDLVVLLHPQWHKQKMEGPPPAAVSAKVENEAQVCEASITTYDICQASQPVANVGCVPAEDLKVLKRQLAEALEVVAHREFELRSGTSAVEPAESAKLRSLSDELAKFAVKK